MSAVSLRHQQTIWHQRPHGARVYRRVEESVEATPVSSRSLFSSVVTGYETEQESNLIQASVSGVCVEELSCSPDSDLTMSWTLQEISGGSSDLKNRALHTLHSCPSDQRPEGSNHRSTSQMKQTDLVKGRGTSLSTSAAVIQSDAEEPEENSLSFENFTSRETELDISVGGAARRLDTKRLKRTTCLDTCREKGEVCMRCLTKPSSNKSCISVNLCEMCLLFDSKKNFWERINTVWPLV